MKIGSDNTGALRGAADPLDRVSHQTPAETAPGPAQADHLTLSPEARTMKALAETAVQAPDIRQDVVDRMRAVLDAGGLGDDAGRLADAIIDDRLRLP